MNLRDRFALVREKIAKNVAEVESPTTFADVIDSMFTFLAKVRGCSCESCRQSTVTTAEAIVVLEEMLKMTPEESKNGIAVLFHKFFTVQIERVVFMANEHRSSEGPGDVFNGVAVLDPENLPEKIKDSPLGQIIRDITAQIAAARDKVEEPTDE